MDQQIARLVQHENGLLIPRLHGDDWMVGRVTASAIASASAASVLPRSFASIPSARQLMESGSRFCPAGRQCAGFHTDQARGLRRRELQCFGAVPALADQHATVDGDGMNLERVPGDVEPDDDDLSDRMAWLLKPSTYGSRIIAHPRPVRAPSTASGQDRSKFGL